MQQPQECILRFLKVACKSQVLSDVFIDADTDKRCKSILPPINCTWSLCIREEVLPVIIG